MSTKDNGFDKAQAFYDAMEPPDYFEDDLSDDELACAYCGELLSECCCPSEEERMDWADQQKEQEDFAQDGEWANNCGGGILDAE